MEMVVNGRKVEKKNIQFVAIFHLLKYGKLMTNLEHLRG